MYYNRLPSSRASCKYIACRGTSKQEGYHAHLHDMLSGNNYSGELAYVLLMFGNFKWNVARGIENAGDNDYGTPQLWRIENINSLAQQIGVHPLPHPTFKMKLVSHTNELFLTKYVAPWADIDAAKAEDVGSAAQGDDNSGDLPPAGK